VTHLGSGTTVLETEGLLLRTWRSDDAEPFAEMNADPVVMKLLGGPLSRQRSDEMLAQMVAHWADHGYGRCAVQERATGSLLGFVGLGPTRAVPLAVEIGWRLAAHSWGRGLATEAARAVRDHAFDSLGLDRLVSVTRPDNPASLAVMCNIGMRHWTDLDHDGLLVTVYELLRSDRLGPPGVRGGRLP
jgi:RimJ/RimL family protein N-acetyltransferase